MGVQGLWALLEPVGRRVNIEALSNKRLAVDASIWIQQFIKAMRDQQGEMLRNAHLLGFFRRICRLLFHRVRPIFVFDGGTPALKKRTLIARRRRKEVAGVKLRKTAEKLLLAQLKQHAIRQAAGLPQPEPKPKRRRKCKGAPPDEQQQQQQLAEMIPADGAEVPDLMSDRADVEVPQDAAAAVHAVAASSPTGRQDPQEPASPPAAVLAEIKAGKRKVQWDLSIDKQRPAHGDTIPDASLARPDTSCDADLAAQLAALDSDDDAEQAQDVALPSNSGTGASSGGPASQRLRGSAARTAAEHFQAARADRAERDAARAAGLPVPHHGAEDPSESDDDEILDLVPAGMTTLDPAVLSTFPPSVQYEMLLKMREAQTAENRERFMERSEKPHDFSSFQMQTFLKASNFRRQLDNVRDSIGKDAPAGMQAKFIASEQGREYILHDSEAAAAAAAAEEAAAAAPKAEEEEVLDISFELPKLPSGADEGEDMEWEDVGPTAGSPAAASASQAPVSGLDNEGKPLPAWRIRMQQRQKFWSSSHGFKSGRKLAEWGERKPTSTVTGGAMVAKDEDAEVQAAIAASLHDAPPELDTSTMVDGDSDGGFEWPDAGLSQGAENSQPPLPTAAPAPGLASNIAGQHPSATSNVSRAAADPPGPSQPAAASGAVSRAASKLSDPPSNVLQMAAAHAEDLKQQITEAAAAVAAETVATGRATDGADVLQQQPAKKRGAPLRKRQKQRQLDDSGDELGFDFSPGKAQLPAAQRSHMFSAAVFAEKLADAAPEQQQPQPQTAITAAQLNQQKPRNFASAVETEVRDTDDWGAELLEAADGSRAHGSTEGPDHGGCLAAAAVAEAANNLRGTECSQGGATEPPVQAAEVDDLEWEDAAPAEPQPPEQPPAAQASQGFGASGGPASPLQPQADQFAASTGQPSAAAESADDDAATGPVQQPAARTTPKRRRLVKPADTTVAGRPSDGHAAAQPLEQVQTGAVSEGATAAAMPQRAPSKHLNAARDAAETQAQHAQQQPRQAQSPPAAPGLAPEFAAALQALRGGQPSAIAGARQPVDTAANDSVRQQHGTPDWARQLDENAVPAAGVFADDEDDLDAAEAAQLAALEEAALASSQEPASQQGAAGSAAQQLQRRCTPAEEVAAAAEAAKAPGYDVQRELARLVAEEKQLRQSNRRKAGAADSVTDDMYGECQELLALFGLPYIIAPMEAEAQCAWMDAAGLVDGVVTDDNDIFLFGGRHVYRHIFENQKYVEEYFAKDLETELGMDQSKLIRLAMLLGSDYTEGINGIGIVNAVEVVNAFGGDDALMEFRRWVLTPDSEAITAATKKGRKGRKTDAAGSQEAEPDGESSHPEADDPPLLREFKRRHRVQRRNWDMPKSFPSSAVAEAYAKPRVDVSRARITHGRPDLQLLRKFCNNKFGWSQEETDDLLQPVLKAYDERVGQARMDHFLSFSQRFAKIKSKRLQKAVAGISGVDNPQLNLGDAEDRPGPQQRIAHADVDAMAAIAEAEEMDPEFAAALAATEAAFNPTGRSGSGGAAAALPAANNAAAAGSRGRSSRGRGGPSGRSGRAGSRAAATTGRGRGRGHGRGRRKPMSSEERAAAEQEDAATEAAALAAQLGDVQGDDGNDAAPSPGSSAPHPDSSRLRRSRRAAAAAAKRKLGPIRSGGSSDEEAAGGLDKGNADLRGKSSGSDFAADDAQSSDEGDLDSGSSDAE